MTEFKKHYIRCKSKLNKFISFYIIFQIVQNVQGYSHFNCSSVSLRYDVGVLNRMVNCTVVNTLVIHKFQFVPEDFLNNDINSELKLSLENLREITGYLIIYDIEGLPNLGQLLPNLAIIRGKQLANNYAFVLKFSKTMKEIGLKSLITIERGHVYIGEVKSLCNLDRIKWDRLTETMGNNFIEPFNTTDCPVCRPDCEYCWDSKHCQVFKDNDQGKLKSNCDEECLGGCYKELSNRDCFVCKNLKENGACVKDCSKHTFFYDLENVCLQKYECIAEDWVVFENDISAGQCLKYCPYGYKNESSICTKCENPTDGNCSVTCEFNSEIDEISNLELLKGCHIINGSISIRIAGFIDYNEFETNLGEIRIIKGYLRIHNSPYIHNIQFLKNLEEIGGDNLLNNHFGLLIYENKNLSSIFNNQVKNFPKFKITKGGMYFDSNIKLCNWEIQKLVNSVPHDVKLDFIFYNDKEVRCTNLDLRVETEVPHPDIITVKWEDPKFQTIEIVEVLYAEIPYNSKLDMDEDLSKDICLRSSWRSVKFRKPAISSYNLTRLHEDTTYAIVVKFFTNNGFTYHTSINYATTNGDFPKPDKVYTISKMYNGIVLGWNAIPFHKLTKIEIEVYKISENKTKLDARDFCQSVQEYSSVSGPFFEKHVEHTEKTCRYRLEEENESDLDHIFDEKIKRKFRCSYFEIDKCGNLNEHSHIFINRFSVEPQKSEFSIENLTHATLYVFKVFFYNKFGCGDYSLHFETTSNIKDANTITNLEIYKYYNGSHSIIFTEPENPNGVILNYNILFKGEHENDKSKIETIDRSVCLSSLELQENNYEIAYNISFNFSISVTSSFEDGSAIPLQSVVDYTVGNSFRLLSCVNVSIILILFIIFIYFTICKRLSGNFPNAFPGTLPELELSDNEDRLNLIEPVEETNDSNTEAQEMVPLRSRSVQPPENIELSDFSN